MSIDNSDKFRAASFLEWAASIGAKITVELPPDVFLPRSHVGPDGENGPREDYKIRKADGAIETISGQRVR